MKKLQVLIAVLAVTGYINVVASDKANRAEQYERKAAGKDKDLRREASRFPNTGVVIVPAKVNLIKSKALSKN